MSLGSDNVDEDELNEREEYYEGNDSQRNSSQEGEYN